MLAIKIWNYFRGYVIIRVEGLTLERLLNLSASHDIYLWDIKRINNVVLELKSTTTGFKELREIVKKVGCRVEIKEKIGLPFTLLKLKERKMVLFGFIAVCMLIFILTSSIWKIDIVGNEQIASQQIISVLKDNNIYVGKLKFGMDKDDVKNILIDNYDHFSFISVSIKGTKLTIEVKEQDIPPEEIDKSYPANVVAKKKGVIVKVVPKNGKAVVEKGQVVSEGDILISGALVNKNTEEYIYVHGEGEVLAITRYVSVIKEPIIKNEEKLTGEVYTQRGIKLGDTGIMFMKGNIPFEKYREEFVEKDLIDLSKWGLDFPIKIVEYEYKELEIKEIKQNIDYIKQENQVKATKEINGMIPENAEIQSKNTKHQVDDNMVVTQVVVETIEDIGKTQIINR